MSCWLDCRYICPIARWQTQTAWSFPCTEDVWLPNWEPISVILLCPPGQCSVKHDETNTLLSEPLQWINQICTCSLWHHHIQHLFFTLAAQLNHTMSVWWRHTRCLCALSSSWETNLCFYWQHLHWVVQSAIQEEAKLFKHYTSITCHTRAPWIREAVGAASHFHN